MQETVDTYSKIQTYVAMSVPWTNLNQQISRFGIEARITRIRSRIYPDYTSLYHQTHSKLNEQPMYSLFGYANWYRGRVGVRGIVVRFPAREKGLCLLHSVKTGSWANQASYSMVKQDGGRAVSKVDHSTHLMPRLPISGALLPLPRVPS